MIVVPLLLLVYDPKMVVALTGTLSLTVAAAVVDDSRREADHRVALSMLGYSLLMLHSSVTTSAGSSSETFFPLGQAHDAS